MDDLTDPTPIALEAFRHGWTPVPLRPRAKVPFTRGWEKRTFEREEQVPQAFEEAARDAGITESLNVGLALGMPHGGLLDVDVDHPKAALIARDLLPATAMRSGRGDAPGTHFWYRIAEDDPDRDVLDRVHQFRLPGQPGAMVIELRGKGGQTVAPGSVHPDGDFYEWGGEPWGGDEGPAVVPLRKLLASVAAIGLLVNLADNWPGPGSRHSAYLALVGGMLRDADDEGLPRVHPGWNSTIIPMVRILAHMTHDLDGASARIAETVHSTRRKIAAGKRVQGWPTLASVIGDAHVSRIREIVQQIEELDGQVRRVPTTRDPDDDGWKASGTPKNVDLTASQGERVADQGEDFEKRAERLSRIPLADRDPLAERQSAWEALDLAPYLLGDLTPIKPTKLLRSDGAALLYPGRTNSLYGAGGSGKTWIALHLACEEIAGGGKVLMVDFEDEPQGTLGRLRALGVDEAAVLDGAFHYVAPDEPIASMQTDRFGQLAPTASGVQNRKAFAELVKRMNPSLVIVDGITTLYSLHGLSTNDATSTDVVSRWLRGLTGGYKRTVVLIDHTSKQATPGADPMGSQHKIAMIQGAALQVYATTRPRPGSQGEALLYVGKDRPGGTYEVSTPEDPSIAGVVRFSSGGETMTITIDPAPGGTFALDATKQATPKSATRKTSKAVKSPPSASQRPSSVKTPTEKRSNEARVLESMGIQDLWTSRELMLASGLAATTFRETLRELVANGQVVSEGKARATRYRLP